MPSPHAHRALVYSDAGAFADGVTAFVRDGLERGDHVLVTAAAHKCAWLREALGDDAGAVDLIDAEGLYERHGTMFRTVLGHLGAAGPERRVRLVAEQDLAARTPMDVRAYLRYEAAANVAYAAHGASVLCPYDAQRLPDEVLDAALRTHPEVVQDGRTRASERFADPAGFVREFARDAPVPPDAPAFPLEAPEDIAEARATVRTQAHAAGIGNDALEDLLVAVSEVAANALLHGRPPRCLWSYVDDGHLVCQVRDAGPGIPDPLAGYLPPDPARLGGRGLWLAHQLSDVVEVASDERRTSVTLHVRLPGSRSAG